MPSYRSTLSPEARRAQLTIAACAGASFLVALLLGGLVMKIAFGIIALTVLQGVFAGGTRLIGVVAGLVLAAPLAVLLGKVLEAPVGALTGTSGLLARFLSMGVIAIGVVLAATLSSRLIARFVLARFPALQRWDTLAGAGLGLLEGCLIALMVLWAPLALEPIARIHVDDTDPRMAEWNDAPAARTPRLAPPPRNPVARAVVDFADHVHASSLGGFLERTNPIEGVGIFALAADFAAVTRDRDAMLWLMDQPVMTQIENLPSVQAAIAALKEDPELKGMFTDGEGVSVATIRAVLESPKILELFDNSTIVKDVAPLTDDLAQAIRDAKARIKPAQ